MRVPAGKIIILNGASSSGKSTLAKALQNSLDEPFWHFSIDHLREANVLPDSRIEQGEFHWRDIRESFFEGFHACLPALAQAGNNLIVEHIIETKAWRDRLLRQLAGYDLFFVGVHCPLDELERRERERQDRPIGDAKRDFVTIHEHCQYDLEVDSTEPVEVILATVERAWKQRKSPRAFELMVQQIP